MKKQMLMIGFLVTLIFLAGYVFLKKNSLQLMNATQNFAINQKTYPFTVTLQDKSIQHVQIYKGTWTATGGNTLDFSHKLQTDINGKITDLPIQSDEQTDSTGIVTFMLPAGQYFVYVSNPAYEDDLPHDISIPRDSHISISGDRH